MSHPILDNTGLPSSVHLLRTGFHVQPDRSSDEVVLRLQGDLDRATVVELRRALAQALEKKPAALALDLSGLCFVDSTGIGVFVGASRRAREVGCSFVLRSPTRPVQKALHLTGVDQLLAIEGL